MTDKHNMTDGRTGVDSGTHSSDSDRREAHLKLDCLHKTYADGIVAVEDLSLAIEEGELLVMVGPSGCGKSTTLRCIAGLEEVSSGDIRIAGDSLLGRRPEDRDIAMVFQNYALYPHKTARDNIGFGLKMTTELSDAAVRRKVNDVADMLGITDLLDKKPKSLSGGQQQRVALGRAIVRDPEVFLLDEPLSNLDATLRGRMRTEIQQLQRDLDVTTVYVTHDQVEAMTIGDRIAVLRDGVLQQVGTPMECYHEPANRFVATFIGEPSMNVFDCRYDPTSASFVGPVTYPAPGPLGEAATTATDRAVGLGFRPEAPTLVAADATTDARTFEGVVDVVEPVGERSFVYVTVSSGLSITVAVPEGTAMMEGDAVGVQVPRDGVHLFDGTTGEALYHPDRPTTDTTTGPPAGRSGGR